MNGTLYGLGVGPGDPEFITLKALRLLRAAPVVSYPTPVDGASFARQVVARWLSPAQTEIVIRVPMEAARFPAQEVYDRAAIDIAQHLAAGRGGRRRRLVGRAAAGRPSLRQCAGARHRRGDRRPGRNHHRRRSSPRPCARHAADHHHVLRPRLASSTRGASNGE